MDFSSSGLDPGANEAKGVVIVVNGRGGSLEMRRNN